MAGLRGYHARRRAAEALFRGLAEALTGLSLTTWSARRARSLIRGLFEDYFDERFAANELGRRVRANVGRRFTGGNAFFAEAVAAFQHAVSARLPATHTPG
jgi:hypothetical protein